MQEISTADRLYHETLHDVIENLEAECKALRDQIKSYRREGNMLIEGAYNSWAETEVLRERVARLEAENKELTQSLEEAKKETNNA